MFRLFCSSTNTIKKSLNNKFPFWWNGSFFSFNSSQKPSLLHTPAYSVNQFNTCQWLLKDTLENVENFNSSKMIIKKDGTIKKKKKPVGVRIYLLNEKGISSSLFLQDAEKLAKHQGLELKREEEINGIPAYRLVPFSDLLKNEIPSIKDEKKKEKIKKLIINSDIKPNDLQTKINHINRFLDKGLKVFVKLDSKGCVSSKLNSIFDELEKALGGHSVSKLTSKSGYCINIVPQEKKPDKDKAQ